ncbi:MAG: sulfite exporter TauE/SafE family protein [Candidatus Omnitrophica bacterium]|nr:sulfite exporter TauE/SafE family protein [Candidatus Omnitrophota bacterium]
MKFGLRPAWTYQNLLRVSFVVLGALCLLAMFGVPLMSARGPSSFNYGGPSPLIVMLIGLAIGCYGTVVGIGGGPLIVPVLFFFYGWETEFLVATSLMIVFLNALSGTIGYAYQKRIDYKGGSKFALAALPGAGVSGFVHHRFDIQIFDAIFGVFLILLAVFCFINVRRMGRREALPRPEAPAWFRRVSVADRFGQSFGFAVDDQLGIYLNLLLGFFVGFLGIGGGVFQVPILLFVLFYPAHIATATSHYVTALTCLFAVLPHVFLGNVFFDEALWMGLGVVVGAQLGAWLSPKLQSRLIIYLFIIIILVFAVKLLF